jgi:hypothetical protein
MENLKNHITGFSVLNDLFFAMSGACCDHLSYKSHPDSLHTDVWFVVDWNVRKTLLEFLYERKY